MDPEIFTIILTTMDTSKPTRKPTRNHKEWSIEEDTYLREGVASGLTAPDLAPDLGRTTPAVYARMYKLGLKRTRQRESAHPLEGKVDEWTEAMHLRAKVKFARDVAVLSLWLALIALGLAIFSLTQ